MSSHKAATMADVAELRTRSTYQLSREGAARLGMQQGPWWCCWWEEKDGGAAVAMDSWRRRFSALGAVLGGERRTGKEEQASEWRGRQQATLGLSLQPATTCRGSAGALLPRGARKLSRSATQSDSKPEWSCKYHLKNAPETQTSSLRNS